MRTVFKPLIETPDASSLLVTAERSAMVKPLAGTSASDDPPPERRNTTRSSGPALDASSSSRFPAARLPVPGQGARPPASRCPQDRPGREQPEPRPTGIPDITSRDPAPSPRRPSPSRGQGPSPLRSGRSGSRPATRRVAFTAQRRREPRPRVDSIQRRLEHRDQEPATVRVVVEDGRFEPVGQRRTKKKSSDSSVPSPRPSTTPTEVLRKSSDSSPVSKSTSSCGSAVVRSMATETPVAR